jgi:hypothetical protein
MKQLLIKKGAVVVEEIAAPIVGDNMLLVQTQYSLISVGTESMLMKASGQTLMDRIKTQPKNILAGLEMVKAKGVRVTIDTIQEMLESQQE